MTRKTAAELHEHVPPDWYFRSIRENLFQRYWHKRRFEEIGKLIEKVDGRVLDLGSADGMFSHVVLAKTKASKLIGVDALASSVVWANKHWQKNKKLEFKVGDAHKLRFKSGTFGAVFALEILEHVYEPDKVLSEIHRVLKKGGYAVLLVPSESNLFKVVWFLWHYSGRMVWEDCHIQSFRNDRLPKMAKKAGFSVEHNRKFLLGMLQAVKLRKE